MCTPLPGLDNILQIKVLETLRFADKYVVVVDDSAAIKSLKPDFSALQQYDLGALILTAHDKKYDFVSRFLKPNSTLKEDPVTGSAHCILAPYWQQKMGKEKFLAYQASPRGGEIVCEVKGNRVFLTGQAALYLYGEIFF